MSETTEKTYEQQIILTRRVTAKSKGVSLRETIAHSAHVSAPTGFEITSVDTWEIRIDKDGRERRSYDD